MRVLPLFLWVVFVQARDRSTSMIHGRKKCAQFSQTLKISPCARSSMFALRGGDSSSTFSPRKVFSRTAEKENDEESIENPYGRSPIGPSRVILRQSRPRGGVVTAMHSWLTLGMVGGITCWQILENNQKLPTDHSVIAMLSNCASMFCLAVAVASFILEALLSLVLTTSPRAKCALTTKPALSLEEVVIHPKQ